MFSFSFSFGFSFSKTIKDLLGWDDGMEDAVMFVYSYLGFFTPAMSKDYPCALDQFLTNTKSRCTF
jgi:hypothetical protein